MWCWGRERELRRRAEERGWLIRFDAVEIAGFGTTDTLYE